MEEGKVNVNQEEVNNNEIHEEESKGKKCKKSKNDKQLEELQEKYDELNDKYLRLFSEFDNYRKRTAKEKIELSKTASESIMVDLLPILDDFVSSIKSGTDGFAVAHATIFIFINKTSQLIISPSHRN